MSEQDKPDFGPPILNPVPPEEEETIRNNPLAAIGTALSLATVALIFAWFGLLSANGLMFAGGWFMVNVMRAWGGEK